jgi:ABC-type Fe3+ transport system substrate-binding protein
VEEGEAAYQEIKAGRSMFDALMPPTESRKQWIDEGIVVTPPIPLAQVAASLPTSWGKVDPRAIAPNGYYVGTKGSVRGLTWNTNLVPGGLKSWDDCLKPEFQGKATIDVRNKNQAFQHDPKYREWWVNQWLPAFAKIGVPERGQTASLEKIAAGQYAIGCGFNIDSARSVKGTGAPLGLAVPEPFHFSLGAVLYITKTSKAPATAELYMLFQASDAGQAGMMKSNQELPWATGSELGELTKGKTMVMCDEACDLKGGDYEKEFAAVLGLPGR